jgi:hypothetical protein
MWSVVKNAQVHYFGDDDANSECVHLLMENPEVKRILLCFRGSITMNDWVKDSKVMVGYIKNPLYMRPNQPAEIGVHLGFREYLYDEKRETSLKLPPVGEKLAAMKDRVRNLNLSGDIVENESSLAASAQDDSKREEPQESKSTTTAEIGESTISAHATDNQDASGPSAASSNMSTSRISRILEEVDSLWSKQPDYRIYVTGHSLGGALAQLSALEIAAHWGTAENPVTYIGIGNPRAATFSFRNVVETLEQEGKMRCLGVHNHLDIVPMIPTSAFHIRTKNTFCQVGFQLLLHTDEFEMKYTPHTNGSWQDWKDRTERMALAIFRPDKIKNRHHYLTYLTYLRDLQVPLSKLQLNDYYNARVKANLFPGSEKEPILSPHHVTAKHKRGSLFEHHKVYLSDNTEAKEELSKH